MATRSPARTPSCDFNARAACVMRWARPAYGARWQSPIAEAARCRLLSRSMRKMRAAAFGLLWALLGAPAAAQDASVAPTSRGGLIYELKIGALAHDVPLTANSKEPLGP